MFLEYVKNVISSSELYVFRLSCMLPTCFGFFFPADLTDCETELRKTLLQYSNLETETHKNDPGDRNQVAGLRHCKVGFNLDREVIFCNHKMVCIDESL